MTPERLLEIALRNCKKMEEQTEILKKQSLKGYKHSKEELQILQDLKVASKLKGKK